MYKVYFLTPAFIPAFMNYAAEAISTLNFLRKTCCTSRSPLTIVSGLNLSLHLELSPPVSVFVGKPPKLIKVCVIYLLRSERGAKPR